MVSEKKIAFIDFDGTITRKDSFLEIIKFQKGKFICYAGLLLNLPWLIGSLFSIIPNERTKEKLLTYFFAGMEEIVFQEKCDLFAKDILPGLIRPGALNEIDALRKQEFEIVVVSASATNWIKNWACQLSLKLIATTLEVKKGIITGRIAGKNCQGEQKVVCILEHWDLDKYKVIYAYGDSSGDKPMLALATKSFYKPFRTA
jgi:HAD superfamily hydrolase (TIGR01490 family)